MKKLQSFLLLLIIISSKCFGQFTNTDDFVNVNRNYFFNDASGSIPVPTAFNATANKQDEYKYLVSTMRLAKRLQQVFEIDPINTPGINPNTTYIETFPTAPSNPTATFRILKTALNFGYTNMVSESGNANPNKNKLHGVFVSPNNTLSGPRPVVLLTLGAGEDFYSAKIWDETLYYAADLAMRGYAVFIYENFAITNKFNATPSYLNQIYPNYGFISLFSLQRNAFFNYISVQLGIAAEQLIISSNTTNNLNVDINRMYAMGGSAGANASLMFAYSDDVGNINFNDNTFWNGHSISFYAGSFNDKSRVPTPVNYLNRIRGVVGFGSNLYSMPMPFVGNVFDLSDQNCPTLFLHTYNDALTPIDKIYNYQNSNVWQYGPAASNLTVNYINNIINFHVYVNCDTRGQHYFPSKSHESGRMPDYGNIISISNSLIQTSYNLVATNTNKTRMKRYSYLGLQTLSIGQLIGNFLNRSTSITNPLTGNIAFNIVPATQISGTGVIAASTDPFGANDYPNGKFINSNDGCIKIPNTNHWEFPNNNVGRYANPNVPIEKPNQNLPMFYPNPTQGKININIKFDETASDFILTIYAVNGSQIYSKTINETIEKENYLTKEIDITNEPNGIYFLRVTANNKVLYTNTFVLNK